MAPGMAEAIVTNIRNASTIAAIVAGVARISLCCYVFLAIRVFNCQHCNASKTTMPSDASNVPPPSRDPPQVNPTSFFEGSQRLIKKTRVGNLLLQDFMSTEQEIEDLDDTFQSLEPLLGFEQRRLGPSPLSKEDRPLLCHL